MLVRAGRIATAAAALCFMALLAPFALYSANFGWRGLTQDPSDQNLFFPWAVISNGALSVHMLTGAVLTLLITCQLVPALRRRWPGLHRWSGRMLVGGALVTALGGLAFIALRGTIGGAWMNAGFALYGALMALAVVQTLRHARAKRFEHHRIWALRLFVLAIGSWLFRVHYGLWFLITDGLGSNAGLTGPFDRVQVVAFYLPYLLALEIWLRWQRPARL